jgi:hypothetical protein
LAIIQETSFGFIGQRVKYIFTKLVKLFVMAKTYIRIELTEKDIKEMVAEKYNLDVEKTTISISHFEGDMREPSYTSIVVTGAPEEKPKQ